MPRNSPSLSPITSGIGDDKGVASFYKEINVAGFQRVVKVVGFSRKGAVTHHLHMFSVSGPGNQRGSFVDLCRVINIRIDFASVPENDFHILFFFNCVNRFGELIQIFGVTAIPINRNFIKTSYFTKFSCLHKCTSFAFFASTYVISIQKKDMAVCLM